MKLPELQRDCGSTGELALDCRRINKRYPGVVALQDVSMTAASGTVHALLGENGAGKSSLIKIITGAQAADSGQVVINGVVLQHASPRAAQRLGVRVVHQERLIARDLSAGANVLLGDAGDRRLGFATARSVNTQAQGILDDLGIEIDARIPASELSAAQQQLVELARAVRTETAVLVMDEPTASLHRDEVATLFGVVRSMVARGVAVVYISHHLHEIFEIADTATILRNGCHVADVVMAEVNRQELVEGMFGRKVSQMRLARTHCAATTAVQFDSARIYSHSTPISVDVEYGRVLALCGESGSGAAEFGELIAGVRQPIDGRIRFGNGSGPSSRRDAMLRGVAYLPADRKRSGLLLERSITENMFLGHSRSGLLGMFSHFRARNRQASEYARSHSMAFVDPRQPIRQLSGGNQQRVILARWVLADSSIYVFDQPTAGVDVNAKFVIYEQILALSQAGAAVVVISSDYEEITGVADRILVMGAGSVIADLPAEGLDPEDLYSIEMGSGGQAA